jgi:hypothetical protein
LTLGGDDYEADPFSSKWVQSVSCYDFDATTLCRTTLSIMDLI